MAFDKTKFIARFAEEAREHIAKINDGLVLLETSPGDMDTLNQIFRSAHTIKGSSKILNLKQINEVSHNLEDALDALRERRIEQSSELFNLVFRSVDCVADMVEKALAGDEAAMDISELCEQLQKAAKGEPLAPPPPPLAHDEIILDLEMPQSAPPSESPATAPAVAAAKTAEAKAPDSGALKPAKPKFAETVRINTDKLDDTVKLMGEIVSNHIRLKQNLVDIDDLGKISKKYLEVVGRLDLVRGSAPKNPQEMVDLARTIHSKVKLLSANSKDVLNFQTLLTDELREKVLKMRMLPLSVALDPFPRLVRDMASSLKKKIHFITDGGETELDKKIIEKIGDPLLHMIRNCIDHAIEMPEERVRAGKPETGVIRLTAGYEGGSVLIRLQDDGAGIPLQKIKEKALRKGLFDEATLNRMSRSEIINLIFRPGFSTAAIITDVSGRGVGMDVVRDNIVMQLKGSVQIETEEGKGTVFFIRLPLTLAVMRVLQITVADFFAALPLNAVTEIIKIPETALIEVVNKKAINLRGQIIPVTRLGHLLGIPATGANKTGELVVVLVAMGSEVLGLIVDAILSEEDMEIKPLPSHMKSNELISGVTLSGKNEIVMVFHVPRLFALAKSTDEKTPPQFASPPEKQRLRILVVDDSLATREIEKNILESYGFAVDTAGDGMEGYEKALETAYDVVITDIEMPGMDGFMLTEKLRAMDAYRRKPIIIVSSRDRDEDKQRGMQAGADAYIIKGAFDQSNLLNTIQSLVL